MELINKDYPEFGYTVRYQVDGDKVTWSVFPQGTETSLMMGEFDSKDFYRSTFSMYNSNMEENTYESLFYLYFENIKLECIKLVEGVDFNETEVEEIQEEI